MRVPTFWNEIPFVHVMPRSHVWYTYNAPHHPCQQSNRSTKGDPTERCDLAPSEHFPVSRFEIDHRRAIRKGWHPASSRHAIDFCLRFLLYVWEHDHGHHKGRKRRGRLDSHEYVDKRRNHLPAHRFDRSFKHQSGGEKGRTKSRESRSRLVLTGISSSRDRLDDDLFLIVLEHLGNHRMRRNPFHHLLSNKIKRQIPQLARQLPAYLGVLFESSAREPLGQVLYFFLFVPDSRQRFR